MRPRLRKARRPRPLVVLTSGWCGEQVLIRLLAANGDIRSSGFWLSVARRAPAAQLRQLLTTPTDDAGHVVLVRAADLFAFNNLDPYGTITDLRHDGFQVMSLRREASEDTGLSRALCGPGGEVLPSHSRVVEPADVIVYTKHAWATASWLAEVVPDEDDRIVLEEHLEDADARAATIARLAARFGLQQWDPPPEHEVPTSKALWSRVANPESVGNALATARDFALADRAS